MTSKLASQEGSTADLQQNKKQAEKECEALRKSIQELDMSLKKAEAEKQSKENQIRNIQDEMHKQEMTLAKLSRERKHQEEVNKKLLDDLQSQEERGGSEANTRQKLQQSLEVIVTVEFRPTSVFGYSKNLRPRIG